MSTYQAELPYPPLSGNRGSRTGQGRHYTPKELVSYRQQVAIACSRLGLARLGLAGPLAVDYVLCAPDLRSRDADNVLKVLNDALTRARVWVDDSNRVIARTTVEWGPVTAGGAVLVVIRELQGGSGGLGCTTGPELAQNGVVVSGG